MKFVTTVSVCLAHVCRPICGSALKPFEASYAFSLFNGLLLHGSPEFVEILSHYLEDVIVYYELTATD